MKNSNLRPANRSHILASLPQLVCVLSVILFYAAASLVFAQDSPVKELDLWKGSSLGIRIADQDGMIMVDKVYDHVASLSSLRVQDQLVEISDTQLTWANRNKISDIMSQTLPDLRVSAVIIRDGQERRISVPTFRRELLDVPSIVEQLNENRIITKHLKETDREDFMDTLSERMVKAVNESKSPREAAEGINALIDEIGVSHTSILSRQSFNQLRGNESGDLGLTLQRHVIDGQNRYFITDRMPGSSGYDSEIVLGDEIVAINDVRLEDSRRLILSGQEHRRRLFFLQVDIGETVTVDFRRRQNSDRRRIELKGLAAVPAADVIELSARVIESGKNQYGYLRFWNLMSMQSHTLMSRVIKEKFAECDMIILDLRGRGGLIPAVQAVNRAVEKIDVPVIAITDDLTRSAKEMLSLLLKKQRHVTVVGQRTAGAVVGATMMQLPSGNGLMYPVMSSDRLKPFTDNAVLEQVGVEPDIELDFQIPWCGGNDRLLQGAIETGDEKIRQFLKTIIAP